MIISVTCAHQRSLGRLLDRVGSMLADPQSVVTGLNVFTFNQVRRAEEWRQGLLAQLPARSGQA